MPPIPPIPIHKNDPIAPTSAAKAPGPTTATANPPPTRTTPASVPATTTASADGPPPPQPGAFPVPRPTGTASTNSTESPAPPQPGSAAHAHGTPVVTATHTTTETRYGGPPPQFAMPSPQESGRPTRSTDLYPQRREAAPGRTTLNFGPVAPAEGEDGHQQQQHEGRRSLEHPPNYVQNTQSAYVPPTDNNTSGGDGTQEGGIGDAAWRLLSQAGEALRKGEEAAWKAVKSNK